ncbi:MAG TPA: hypothetical protein VGN84_10295 [Solirubrobacterales bacterium]|nr:hypothetical protein [Solirubrobacterales bacterium]
MPSRLPADRVGAIEALRRLRMTAAEIAEVRHSALDGLQVAGANRTGQAQSPEPPNRYEGKRPES